MISIPKIYSLYSISVIMLKIFRGLIILIVTKSEIGRIKFIRLKKIFVLG